MRARKSLPRGSIKEVYGNWRAVRAELSVMGGQHIMEQYYYRRKGMWYPTTLGNLIKRDIIKMKETVMTIAGKDYPYVLCSRCGIWIHKPKFLDHYGSPECVKWAKNRETRDGATRKVLGALNRGGLPS